MSLKLDAVKVFYESNTREGKKYIKRTAKSMGIKVPFYLTSKTERRINQICQEYY